MRYAWAMDYILALDQGTTSSRAMLFDREGRVSGIAQKEFAQHFPQPGWVEHDASEIWRTQLDVAREVLRHEGVSAKRVAAIGITNQRETTVLWDRRTGEPVGRAIVWQDRRTAQRCDTLTEAGHAGLIQEKTGLVVDAYFSATKLEWMLDHVPGARARAARGELAFGTVDSWLIWNLTGGPRSGVHVIDASNASRTMLFNINTLDWDDELLALFDVPRAVLPRVVPSCGEVGRTEAGLLGAALPIAGVAGDQQAATFGQACFTPGMAKNTYGTGCFMLMNTGAVAVPSRNRLLTTVAWVGPLPIGVKASSKAANTALTANTANASAEHEARAVAHARDARGNACYALEGGVFMAGATVQWLRDGLQIIRSAPEVESLAAGVPDTGDVFLVPAFAGLGAPDWDGHARGTLVGMTRGTTRAHIARAALEAIALQVADVFAAMTRDARMPLAELRVDGGASANDLLMQMQADFLGVPVVRPKVTETTALGAACLAGLAVGFWRDAGEITARWAVDKRFEPVLGKAEREAHVARWRQAVERSRGWSKD